MTLSRRFLTTAALTLLLMGCTDSSDGGLSGPPQPGELVLTLLTPNLDDSAILFALHGPGPIDEIRPVVAGHLLHYRVRGNTVNVVVFGQLNGGELIHFSVPDVRLVDKYGGQVVEVADVQNRVRSSHDGYMLQVARQRRR
jgi:hypothetical protein